jgi:Tol biopolymer transport system component/tRNA A-37 threonylcarbamoyl transferase component Bud32
VTPERLRQIEELFHEASDRPSGERARFLAAQCGDDDALRREVESLLDQQDGTLLREGLGGLAVGLTSHQRVDKEGLVLADYVLGPLIGSGGMGAVYRARDVKLGREVAVKLLSAKVARPEQIARFRREAQILASINHPHIAAIYGIVEDEENVGLVLELVDGQTLAERLHGVSSSLAASQAGGLPLSEALGLARQIADALHAAHRRGIVHRDLKPANIEITLDGTAKVLDFGVAKMESLDQSGPAAEPLLATRDGVLLGTVAYMSPEQARGLAVDTRTDVWAFGCVLYEMLTGVRAFPGANATDVLAKITSEEPDWSRLPAATPARIRDLLRHCLLRDRERRLADISDGRAEIERAIADVSEAAAPIGRALTLRFPNSRIWLGGLVALLAVGAAIALWIARATPAIPLPPDVSVWAVGRGSSVALSPDGRQLVYVGISEGRRRLYRVAVGSTTSRPLAGTEDAANPFFSPDGEWIGFIDMPNGGRLKIMRLPDGPALTVAANSKGVGDFAITSAWWSSDDTIVFAAINPVARGLWRVAAAGGTATQVTTPGPGEGHHSWPQILPGGRTVLYTIWRNNNSHDSAQLALQSLDGGQQRILADGGSYARVVTRGDGQSWLVYARPEGLMAAAIDLDRLELLGRPVPCLQGVLVNMSGGAHYSLSDTGTLAFVPGGLDEVSKTAVWVERGGHATEIGVIPGLGFEYRLSPDGHRLVRPNATGPTRDLYIEDLRRRGTPRRLSFNEVVNVPVWNHDGSRIIYASSGSSPGRLISRSADGTGGETQLTASPNRQIPGSVSRDGTLLAYVENMPDTGSDILLLNLRDRGAPRTLVGTPAGDVSPRISPDGQWLAYQSRTSGRAEVYLSSIAGDRHHIPVSNGDGFVPLWSPDGDEIYYRDKVPTSGEGHMMAVPVDVSGPEPRVGAPRVLFPAPYQGDGDIGPDGRFLLLRRTPWESPARKIPVISDWFDELQAKARRR